MRPDRPEKREHGLVRAGTLINNPSRAICIASTGNPLSGLGMISWWSLYRGDRPEKRAKFG